MTGQQGEISGIQKGICSWTMISSLVVASAFILFHENAIAKGLLLGALFSVLNFLLLGKSIFLTLGCSRSKAFLIRLASILTRYALLAIPLLFGIKSTSFDFIAIVVGIFGVQIVTLINFIIVRPILDGE